MRYMKCTYCGIIETTDTLRLDADESGYCPNCHMTQFFREHEHKPCCSAATTLQQLEELLRDGWLITCEYGPFWITNRDYDTHDPYPTLPAAIAAAWERMVE